MYSSLAPLSLPTCQRHLPLPLLPCVPRMLARSMCLFLQTQNFQQVTAALVTDMHASSAAANASLSAIRTDLHSQAQALSQSLSSLARLRAAQSEVQAAVQAGLVEVQAVGRMSQGLQHSMDKSLNTTVSGRGLSWISWNGAGDGPARVSV